MACLKSAVHVIALFCCLWPIGIGLARGDDASLSVDIDHKPLWEIGVSVIAAILPHYIGSDEYQNYIFPFPYIIYRGEIFKSDRDGLRGLFFKGERFESDISLWGYPPVADDNEARKDMPELDSMVEIGPAIRYYFHRRKELDHLYLQASWRGAVSIGFRGGLDVDSAYQGQRISLDLKFKNKSFFETNALSLYVTAGINFADETLNGYFYDVQTEFIASDRNRYDADAGYGGFYLSSSVYKELTPRIEIGGYARWYNINGAVFEDSPLVRTHNNFSVGCVLVYKFAVSKEMVSITE